MIITKVERPYVHCTQHGRQFGYTVCIHIYRDGKPIHHVVRASPENNGGEISCGNTDHYQHEKSLLCEKCAIEIGYLEQLH